MVRHIVLIEPRARGRMRRNPGLNAREKLSPVVAEPEVMTQHLHRVMMSPLCPQVKPDAKPSAEMPLAGLARSTAHGQRARRGKADRNRK